MLILGTWGALLLYIISWISGFFHSPSEKPSSSNFQGKIEITGIRLGWIIHTVSLFGLLWSKSIWPTTFVIDILNVTAWGSMVCVQAFPDRLPSLVNTSIVRLFAILLLGLCLILFQLQMYPGNIVSNQTWVYQLLLGSHIIILIAGYILLGVACVASIVFLYQEHHLKTKLVTSLMIRLPALSTLDRLCWEGTLWGFLALSIGIMLGILINDGDKSMLANLRFFSSISAWFVFAMILLMRQLHVLRSNWKAILPMVGFVLALMSFVVEILRLNI